MHSRTDHHSEGPLASMPDRDFRLFRDLIYSECGINLVPAKRVMLTSRLRKRLKALAMASFQEYFEYISSPTGQAKEMHLMLDAVSTNKTDFFREPKHFACLEKEILSRLVHSGRWKPGRRLNIWSAGCSSGEEPYTIAMVLSEFCSRNRTGDFVVLATDISTQMLERGRKGIYAEDTVEPVPNALKRKYLMRGKGTKKGRVRIVPELRNRVQFMRVNLNEGRDFGIRTRMDIIFCRNVIIYFDRETQVGLFEKFHSQLMPGGHLFIGHSETLNNITDRFEPVAVSVYRRPA